MKAAVVRMAGGPEVLELADLPRPEPQPGRVLIAVKAFGLNRGEVLTRQGHSPSVTFPRILGIECVGTVVAAPAGEFAPGTTVAAVVGGMGRAYDGSYAEFVAVPAASVYALRTDLDWVRLAAIPESFVTAWGGLYDALEIERGQTILVRGATSSVGLTAVSLAKRAGLRVLATTRRDDRKAALIEEGADDVLIDDGTLAPAVRALVPGGVDRVLDYVGTIALADTLRCVALHGVACTSGILGNAWTIPEFSPAETIPAGVKLTTYSSTSLPIERGARLQDAVDGVASGRYRLRIDRVFPLDAIVDAHRWMEENRAVGKIVVTVDA